MDNRPSDSLTSHKLSMINASLFILMVLNEHPIDECYIFQC